MAPLVSLLFLLSGYAFAGLPIGFHDATDCTSLRGWTCDVEDPRRPVAVHFYEGSTFLGGMFAEIRREDAVGMVCGGLTDVRHLQHGYDWTVPEQLRDGARHHITLYAIDPHNPDQQTTLGTVASNCPPTSARAGFWDEGIASGRAQSDYDDRGCIGAPPLIYGPCAFLPAGGQQDFWTPSVEDPYGDGLHTAAMFENCPTESLYGHTQTSQTTQV